MKEGGLIFVALFFIFIGISYTSAVALHNAGDFQIDIEGNSMTVQGTIDSGYMRRVASSYASSSIPLFAGEHSADQIWVNVNGEEKTLLSALRSADGLCGSGEYLTYESSEIPNPGHVATDILLASGKTLQQAINDGDFCGCIAGTQKTCDIFDSSCTNYVEPVTCNDEGICSVTCGDYGVWPVCNIESYTARGTSCASDGWHSCDGAGKCVGWSGTGCTGFSTSVVNGVNVKCWMLSDSSGYYVGTNNLGTAFSSANINVLCSYDCDCEISGSCDTCSKTWYIKPGTSKVDNSCSKPSSSSGGGGHDDGGDGGSTASGGGSEPPPGHEGGPGFA